jgi:hypothetical protein
VSRMPNAHECKHGEQVSQVHRIERVLAIQKTII